MINQLPYTICFCISGTKVLMVERIKPPNKGKWNGLGGKIEQGETPRQAVIREIFEESGIKLRDDQSLKYVGVVTWPGPLGDTADDSGMHSFIAYLGDNFNTDLVDGGEGNLEWKDLDWVCDQENEHVVWNIPHFLPAMISSLDPVHYHLIEDSEENKGIEQRELTLLTSY